MGCVAEVACQLLVVHAREDELISLRTERLIAREASNVRVEIIENSYHMAGLEHDRAQPARSRRAACPNS